MPEKVIHNRQNGISPQIAQKTPQKPATPPVARTFPGSGDSSSRPLFRPKNGIWKSDFYCVAFNRIHVVDFKGSAAASAAVRPASGRTKARAEVPNGESISSATVKPRGAAHCARGGRAPLQLHGFGLTHGKNDIERKEKWEAMRKGKGCYCMKGKIVLNSKAKLRRPFSPPKRDSRASIVMLAPSFLWFLRFFAVFCALFFPFFGRPTIWSSVFMNHSHNFQLSFLAGGACSI